MKRLIQFNIVVISLLLFAAACATGENALMSREGDICVKPVEKVRIPEKLHPIERKRPKRRGSCNID